MQAFVQTYDPSTASCPNKDDVGDSFVECELDDIRRELSRRNVTIHTFCRREVEQRHLTVPLSSDTFVAGDLMVMWRLIQGLNVDRFLVPSYPEPLADMLHRRVGIGTVAELYNQSWPPDTAVFIKPYYLKPFQGKRFKGQILASLDAIAATSWIPSDEKLICSEVVNWASEYRVYVLNSRILGVHQYVPGIVGLDEYFPELKPDMKTIEEAVRRLDAAGLSVAGYCLDFGVLDIGQTALVEMNDGLSLNNYGLNSSDYTDLLIARWRELIEQSDLFP